MRDSGNELVADCWRDACEHTYKADDLSDLVRGVILHLREEHGTHAYAELIQ